ncbi:MAG: alpha/beta hydrolase, partial [Alphaproteobacteria bacterium]|nr:alpha/beta hydrolase [Alphaproteobacteria bacterium]
RHFDPKKFRVILYDQRGAGKSLPYADIRDNTPDLLVKDLEKLRTHLGIDKWHVFGHSWGSTLSLLYAEKHPKKVSSLTVSGIFLMRKKDVDWFVNDMGNVYPEAQEEFVKFLPPEERKDLLSSYFNRLADPRPEVHLPAAKVWSDFETACATLSSDPYRVNSVAEEELALSRLEAHYMKNNLFTPDNRIIADARKIRNIPTVILNGRFDTICPAEGAYSLKQALPNAHLEFFTAGHAPTMTSGYEGALRECAARILKTGSPLPKPK